MSSAEDSGFRSSYVENDSATISAASSVTFHAGSGSDTATDRYLNLPQKSSFGLEIIPTVACSISKFNGKVLKAPISVGTGGYSSNNVRVQSVTITAGSETTVEVTMKGGN